ncbi:MAG: hypothetical protein MI919_00755, partial [Holophagales bacterium]|nr:hypothetical protein [Holophagales bacterium]
MRKLEVEKDSIWFGRSRPPRKWTGGFLPARRSRLLTILAFSMCWTVVLVLLQPTPSPAIFGGIGKAFTKVVSGVGKIAGAPFGGIVDGMTSPTIRNAESAGKRLISSMDSAMKDRIHQVDATLAENIGRLDASMEARILQLDEVVT